MLLHGRGVGSRAQVELERSSLALEAALDDAGFIICLDNLFRFQMVLTQ